MADALAFLVLDYNNEGRLLLSRTLQRRFPECTVVGCSEIPEAIAAMEKQNFSVIIIHRPVGMTGEDATRELLKLDREIPIVIISGSDRSESAFAAGARAFLLYDSWLLLGGVITDLLKNSREPWPRS